MAKWILLNEVFVGVTRFFPGTIIDDAVQPLAPIQAVGGQFWPGSDPVVLAAAQLAQQLKARGQGQASPLSDMVHAGALASLLDTDQPLSNPTVDGLSSFLPGTVAPAQEARTKTAIYTAQTTAASHTSIQVGPNIPLPGTAGAPCTQGQFDLDVELSMVSTTTAVGARFKMSWSWAVVTPGSPVAMGALLTSLQIGTNAGAPPSGWSAALQLDGTSKFAQVIVTGDASLTVDVKALTQWGYLF